MASKARYLITLGADRRWLWTCRWLAATDACRDRQHAATVGFRLVLASTFRSLGPPVFATAARCGGHRRFLRRRPPPIAEATAASCGTGRRLLQGGAAFRGLVQAADNGDHLALDPDVIRIQEDRVHGGVGRL